MIQFGVRDFVAIFLGALLQGATGFGSAVFMNAIMSLFHSIKTISPIIAAYKLLTGTIVLIGRFMRGRLTLQTYKPTRNSKRIHLGLFMFMSFIGIYGGKIALLSRGDQMARWAIAALVLVGQLVSRYSGNNESEPLSSTKYTSKVRESKDYFITIVLGLGAGMFGYAYNTNGPFVALLVLFQHLRKKHAINFSTLYFLGMNVVFLVMHNSFGFMHNLRQPDILIGFGLIALGATVGVYIQKYISEAQYRQIINIFLIISIILLLI
ncbi:MAG: sulfite exporter TauE/SafE family protein [Candidatus Absconditabacterales bacterium]